MAHELETLVSAALAGEHDFDAAWQRLCDAVEAAPAEPALRRLRAQLAEASYQRAVQVEDLRALCALDPGDRDAALRLGLLQHRWADRLVELDPDVDQDDEAAVAAAEEAAEAAAAQLRREAAIRLGEVAGAHAGDAAFSATLLERWDEHVQFGGAWLKLRLALQAAAAHPADAPLQRHLALAWTGLASLGPCFELPDGQQPVGFAVDAYGQPHDALITERALAALSAALAADPADAELHEARAGLWLGLSRFADAAAAQADAAAAWRERARRADGDEARDAALDSAAQADAEAARAAGGRAALTQSWLQDMEGALSRLGEGLQERPDASEAAQAFLAQMREGEQARRAELAQQFAEGRPAVEAAAAPPDAQALARLDALADQLSASVLGSLAFAPAQWIGHAAPALDARLSAGAERWPALGLRHLAWVENPALSEQFGAPTIVGLWVHPSGDAVLSHAAVRHLESIDVETELDDGRQFVTTLGRGRNFLLGGPSIDTLHVDGDLAPEELLALHRARVALALAQSPGARVRPLAGVDDYAAMQERQRAAKTAFRVAEGLSAFEALAVPVDQPEHFADRFRQAVQARVAQAAADFRRISRV